MIFLLSLCIAILFTLSCGDILRKKPVPFYIGTVVISILSIILAWTDMPLPVFFSEWLIPIIAGGGLTGALFVLVMYAGAFPNRSLGAKTFMPIRGQLSIIASIIGIGHSIAYGKSYYKMAANGLSDVKTSTVVFIVISTVMELKMIPLFITSFVIIRRKINGTTWKKIQRLAYPFYFLLFVHVMMLMVPHALRGESGYDLTVFVYVFVYCSYLICKIIKTTGKKALEKIPKRQMTAVSVALLIATSSVAMINNEAEAEQQRKNAKAKEQVEESTEVIEQASSLSDTTLKDGTFVGEGMGNNGTIAIELTVENGSISNIAFTKFCDDEEYFAIETEGKEMIERVLAKQSSDVDGISGATYSSEGYLDAVEDALNKSRQSK